MISSSGPNTYWSSLEVGVDLRNIRRRKVALRDFFWMVSGGGQRGARSEEIPPAVIVVIIVNSLETATNGSSVTAVRSLSPRVVSRARGLSTRNDKRNGDR